MARTVLMRHPDLPGADPAVAGAKAYAQLYAPKGWVLVSPATGEYIDPVPDPSKVTGDALDEALAVRGLSTDGTAAAKRDRLAAAVADEPEVGSLPDLSDDDQEA